MSTRNYVEELEYQDSKGMDSTTPLPQMADGYVRSALNCNLSRSAGYEKRPGFTPQLTTLTGWTTLAIRSGIEFRDSSGVNKPVLYGTDDSSTAKLGVNLSGTITDIADVTPAYNTRVSMLQFGDNLQMVNGDTTGGMPCVYDGVKPRDIGIPAPSASRLTFTSEATGGNLNLLGSYVFVITYVREVGGVKVAESSPSETFSHTLTGSNNLINWAFVQDTGAGYLFNNGTDYVPTHVYLYRTVGDGNLLLFEKKVAYATGTITSDTRDAGLSGLLEEDNSQYSIHGDGKPRYGIVARNRVFYVMDDNLVIHSKIGQIGPMPESFEAKAQSTTEGKHGSADKIVGLGVANDIPIVVKEMSVGRLDEVGIPNLLAVDNVAYVYREISSVVGGTHHFAGISVRGEYVFLGRNNIYATNGGVVREVGDTISSIVTTLSSETGKIEKISAGNDTKKQRIYFSVYKDTGASQPNYVLVGDYQGYPEFRWTIYGAGEDIATHPGIQAGCFFQTTSVIDGTQEINFGNSYYDYTGGSNDFSGQYYRMNDGDTDVVTTTTGEYGIYFELRSRAYSIKQPNIIKLWKNCSVQASAEDSSYELTIAAAYDLSPSSEGAQLFTIAGSDHRWAVDPAPIKNHHKWAPDADALIWAGSNLSELVYDPHHKAKYMQLIFSQTEADAPVSLLGWGASAVIFGPQKATTS